MDLSFGNGMGSKYWIPGIDILLLTQYHLKAPLLRSLTISNALSAYALDTLMTRPGDQQKITPLPP